MKLYYYSVMPVTYTRNCSFNSPYKCAIFFFPLLCWDGWLLIFSAIFGIVAWRNIGLLMLESDK